MSGHPSFPKDRWERARELDGGLVQIHWTEPDSCRMTYAGAVSRRGLNYIRRAMNHLHKIEKEESGVS